PRRPSRPRCTVDMARVHLLASAALGVLLACRPAPERRGAGEGPRDSAGITIRRLPPLPEITSPAWHSTGLFTTLALDSLPLGRLVDARFQADGSVIITQDTRLLRLAPDGRLAGTMGREGDGPGEFRLITALGLAADGTLLIGDLTQRVTELNPESRALRALPFLGGPAPRYERVPAALLPDGGILASYWQQRPNRDTPGLHLGAFDRDSAPLLLYDSSGALVAALGTWPGLERARVTLDGEPARLPPPFARTFLIRSRGRATAVTVTDSLDLSLYRDTTLVLRLIGPAPAAGPSRADLASWELALKRDFPDVAERYLRAIHEAPRVPTLPALEGLGLDDLGRLWIGYRRLATDSLRRWLVLAPDGTPLGHLDLPALPLQALPGGRELLDIAGDRLALLREVPTGEPYVEVRRFHP
ncbi:MAG TPA: hypothetical protein VNH46_09565, partial [Gemmatimonadales bacterium]|nr:hypothetical protein [Gemmatimonadales bacterium]